MTIWQVVGIVALIILSILGLGVLLTLFYLVSNTSIEISNRAVSYFLEWQRKHIENRALRLQSKIHFIKPDKNGFNGIVYDGDSYLNLDTGEIVKHAIKEALSPIQGDLNILKLQSYQQRKMLVAMNGLNLNDGNIKQITSAQETISKLPSQIKLFDIINPDRISLDNLTIGVSENEYGQIEPVQQSIHDLMHLLSIGITGAGKSTWVLAFLAEIAMCQDDIDICAIDVHGSAFNILQNWSKLRYPVARTNDHAKAILTEIQNESKRRMKLYESVPMADSLLSYNANSQDEKLTPWLVVIDEGTILLSDSDISSYIASAVQGTRQYGIYIFMTGQTAKSNVIDTPIRDNFPTRIAFNNEKTSWRVVLGDMPEGELDETPGRGWARLKGHRKPIQIQAPYIRRRDFYDLIERNGPKFDMPEFESDVMRFDELVRCAFEKYGNNKSAICRELGLSTGGGSFYRITTSLESQGLI